jgi:hypothetical protein
LALLAAFRRIDAVQADPFAADLYGVAVDDCGPADDRGTAGVA